MTTRRSGYSLAFALAGALVLTASAARAGNPCIDDGKETFTDCKAGCTEDFQTAKDACLNRDHDCVEACRAGRDECIMATSLDEDLTACRDDLRAAKQACRDDPNNPAGSASLDSCIDAVQVTAFLCRRQARTTAKPALTACRAGFKACAKACPSTGTAVIDKVQCKIDAKNAYLACKADCREAFQTQRDLCNNRDHACVEGCRAGRDSCRQPFEDQLDADIAACNATRDATLANCPSDPDPAKCDTDARVAAFECRDQARENAKPNFAACSAGFQSCATACPPPPS
jgi:hypothetical protein